MPGRTYPNYNVPWVAPTAAQMAAAASARAQAQRVMARWAAVKAKAAALR